MKISKKIINSRHVGYIAGVSFVLTKKGQKRAKDSNKSFQVNQLIKGLKNKSNSYFLKNSLTALALFYMWCPSALMAMNDDISSYSWDDNYNSTFYCLSPLSSEKIFVFDDDGQQDPTSESAPSVNTEQENRFESPESLEMSVEPLPYSSQHAIERSSCQNLDNRPAAKVENPPQDSGNDESKSSPRLNGAIIQDINGEYDLANHTLALGGQQANKDFRSRSNNLLRAEQEDLGYAEIYNNIKDREEKSHNAKKRTRSLSLERKAQRQKTLEGYIPKDAMPISVSSTPAIDLRMYPLTINQNVLEMNSPAPTPWNPASQSLDMFFYPYESQHADITDTRSCLISTNFLYGNNTSDGNATPIHINASLNPMPRSEPLLPIPITSFPLSYMVMTPLVPIPHSISGRGNRFTTPSTRAAQTNFAEPNKLPVQSGTDTITTERRKRLQKIHNAYPQKIKNMTPHAVAKMLGCNHKTARIDLEVLNIPFKDLSRKSRFSANLKNPLLYSNEDKITSLEHFNLGLQFEEERKHNLAIHHYGLSFLDTIE